ncbi:glycosyl hydrolase [Brachybacterium endophyticum]|uniref:Glycosyl hydrolase n=1 Tax=Brachybacterium endophyticum TaxID=2182385 RepID=A0A2U2RH10_9MICO|nr:glycosyltransferase [Brachybacterium endophyticum]PWH05140.1 glycosyl hydrolase [Brachybacterium endophyticum]
MTTAAKGTAPPAAGITVLMPVWRGDRADRFAAALASATTAQTLAPAELVLTVDGELTAELDEVVASVEAGEYGPARVLRAAEHQGLARTLQRGLEAARTDLIARADADDLCRPERLQVQETAMREGQLDLLSASLQEFSDEVPVGTGPLRTRPLTHEQILRYLPRHSPFQHPAVMMRRDVALAVGGYRELDHLEDYWLWERMLLGGARSANLPAVLVDYRVDSRLFARRGGARMFGSDLRLQWILLRDRVTTPQGAAANLVRRAAYRFAPGWMRRLGYRFLVERMQ